MPGAKVARKLSAVNRNCYVYLQTLLPSPEFDQAPVGKCLGSSDGENHLTLAVPPDPSGQQYRASEGRQFRKVLCDKSLVPVVADLRYLIWNSV